MNRSLLLVLLASSTGGALADSLFLGNTGGRPGELVNADLRLLNERRIVAIQFDLKIPAGHADAMSAVALEGMDRHRVTTRMAGDRLKVVIHSPVNAEIPNASFLSIPLTLRDQSPDGGPALKIENLIFTNAVGQDVSGAVFYHPVEAWRQERFSEAQLADPSIAGDASDPDGDGFTNLMEFILRHPPPAGGRPRERAAARPAGTPAD